MMFDMLKVFLRDVMRYQVGPARAQLINVDMKPQVERWARALTTAQTLAAIEALNDAQFLIERMVNPQLVTERALRELRLDPTQLERLHART